MKRSTFKRCGCRDEAGQQLGDACTKLRNAGHGSWYFTLELPAAETGRRKQMRRGGFPSQKAAEAERDRLRARLSIGAKVDDQTTVGQFLEQWLRGQQLRPSTMNSYRSHIDNHLRPHLGHVPLDKLRVSHVAEMFREIAETGSSGPATWQRIRATLRSALSDAVREQRITVNPASLVKLPSGKAPKPVVWTDERVAAWRDALAERQAAEADAETGPALRLQRNGRPVWEMVPHPKVAVWTPKLTGQFLDHATTDRLGAMWHTLIFTGLRRGELVGLRWLDLDLDAQQLAVSETLVQVARELCAGDPKSSAGERVIPLDTATVAMLRTHKAQQAAAQLAWGEAWEGQAGRVFTRENGSQLNPEYVSRRFKRVAFAADVPPIRLHDARHGTATLNLAAGADMKVVSELLGHSQISITANTYTSVLPEMARAAAENAAALVPRQVASAAGVSTSCPQSANRSFPRDSAAKFPQVRRGGAGGARTHDRRIMSQPPQVSDGVDQ